MSVFAYHFQKSPQGWPLAYAQLSGGLGKFLFELERCREAKGVNPKVKTWYRWVGKQPLPSSNYEQHARDWLNQFIDGTFRREAQHVDYIQEYNETLAASQSPEERARWIALHTAMAKVWAEEYRQEAALSHIRMILCETAIGNDIPWQIAAAAQKYNAVLGYHPYIVCRVGKVTRMAMKSDVFNIRHDAPRANFRSTTNATVPSTDLYRMVVDTNATLLRDINTRVEINRPDYVSPHDWRWYSGRWATMDAEYKARGISVDWAFGEAGPVRDASPDWSGWLDPQGGWKHGECLNGDMNKYVAVMRYWLDNAVQTPAYKEGRLLGQQLFTSGAPGSGPDWNSFDVIAENMDRVAKFSNEYDYPPIGVPPPPPPPPDPPPVTDDGLPRVQYRREYLAVPQNATLDQWLAVCTLAFAEKNTCGFSADDAGIGALDKKKAVMYGLDPTAHVVYANWFAANYPGTVVEFKDYPAADFSLVKWPADTRRTSQMFGENIDWYKKEYNLCCGHNGVDFLTVIGSPIYATAPGVITLAGGDAAEGYGLHVRMSHDSGYETRYGHLSRVTATVGNRVAAGSLLGYSGNTGFSTGPHLHYELRRDGVAVNPWPYLQVVE